MRLLRASSFCRRRWSALDRDDDEEITFELFNHNDHIPDKITSFSESNGKGVGDHHEVVGESSIVFVTVELLMRLEIITGSIVWVEVDVFSENECICSDSAQKHQHHKHKQHPLIPKVRRRSLARVRYLPLHTLHSFIERKQEQLSTSTAFHTTAYLSPILAANLGLIPELLPPKLSWIGTLRRVLDIDIHKASRVVLRRWAKPLQLPGSNDVDEAGVAQPSKNVHVSHLSLPPEGTLLQRGSLLSIVSRDEQLSFFQVESVQTIGDDDTIVEGDNYTMVAVGTMITRYFFADNDRISNESPNDALEYGLLSLCCPNLPSFSDAFQFLRPPQSPTTPISHPDVPALVKTFRQMIANGYSSRAIFNYVGTDDDHHATHAVQYAAQLSGRQLIDMGHSMVAFGYLHGAMLSAAGSLADKLAGLQLGIRQAIVHAPSVLLVRIDLELSQDQIDREDQEIRFWYLLSQFLFLDSPRNKIIRGSAAHVVVMLLTSKPLDTNGPLSQRIMTDGLIASPPSDAYIQSLWEKDGKNILDHCQLELLRKRSPRDVELIQRRFQNQKLPEDSVASAIDRLQSCCHLVDQEKRVQLQAASPRIASVHWHDIGGLDHVRREVFDTIMLPLLYPHLLPKSKEGSRSGMLLFGPPGTGKTLVAKAVATECSLPFISVRGPELMASYIGESEENMRETFANARRLASQNHPAAAVLFFDELDSLAPRRGDHASGGNVTDRVVATMLAELDKRFEGVTIFCMGATNRPDLLDPALLRPGRLDRLVYLGVNSSDHLRILTSQFRNLRLEGEIESMAAIVAKEVPPTATGADLSSIASAALIRATDRLCLRADGEYIERIQNGKRISMDQILSSWDENRLKPIVTLEDLVEAAKSVIPSVTECELSRYERLRDELLCTRLSTADATHTVSGN